jgi:23S rRNA pseudouridine955/2504/2580 synthase
MQKKFFTKVKLIKFPKYYIKQRIDNFLLSYYKILSKNYIQKIIRKGEVRVNKKRINNSYYLCAKDIIRIPPIYTIKKFNTFFFFTNYNFLKNILNNVLYENKIFIVINKQTKISVHSGLNNKINIIEIIKNLKKKKYIELVHRIDKYTSGCLMLSKSFITLQMLNEQLKKNKIKKIYHLLCYGNFYKKQYIYINIANHFRNKTINKISYNSLTMINCIKNYSNFSLLKAILYTGKTHQIRINMFKLGKSIIGETKYINHANNVIKIKNTRLCLHSKKIKLICPLINKILIINAPYDYLLNKIINI